MGLNGGVNPFAYVASNPGLRIDPAGLFSLSIDDSWGMATSLAGGLIGKTDGSMTPTCECAESCDKSWKLTGCHVDFHIKVLILAGLAPDADAFSRQSEWQHVVDLAGDSGRIRQKGEETEGILRSRSFPSREACVERANLAMRHTMLDIMGTLFAESRDRWDYTGLHTFRAPRNAWGLW